MTAPRPDFCAVRELFKRVCSCGAPPNAHAFRIGAPNCACKSGAKNVRNGAEQMVHTHLEMTLANSVAGVTVFTGI